MLSREDNELLTRTGPGTPMGALLREYWIPVVESRELLPGGRVKRSGRFAGRGWAPPACAAAPPYALRKSSVPWP